MKSDFSQVIAQGKVTHQMSQNWETLKTMIVQKSFKYTDEPTFKLVSGKMSQYYIDCKMTTLYSKGAALVGEILFSIINTLSIKGIGGLTLGADPIAYAAAVKAGFEGIDLIPFVIRKQAKSHGMKKWVEGGIEKGDPVVIIDDVITTGGSTIMAIEKAEAFGLKVLKVIVLVDREEGGRDNIQKLGYDVFSIYNKSELLDSYLQGC